MNAQNTTQAPVRRWRELLASERDAAALYSRLAEAETGERQQIFRVVLAAEPQVDPLVRDTVAVHPVADVFVVIGDGRGR